MKWNQAVARAVRGDRSRRAGALAMLSAWAGLASGCDRVTEPSSPLLPGTYVLGDIAGKPLPAAQGRWTFPEGEELMLILHDTVLVQSDSEAVRSVSEALIRYRPGQPPDTLASGSNRLRMLILPREGYVLLALRPEWPIAHEPIEFRIGRGRLERGLLTFEVACPSISGSRIGCEQTTQQVILVYERR